MSKYSAIILTVLLMFIIGCGSQSKYGATSSQNTIQINRAFEDLTLGMAEEDLRSRVAYEGPFSDSGEPYGIYFVYSALYNHYHRDAKMKILENIYQVYCYFIDNKLFQITIEYNNRYDPSWDSFVSKAIDKYGRGTESLNRISWNDGKTKLVIKKETSEQITGYGEHYVVTYSDNELLSVMRNNEKERSPDF